MKTKQIPAEACSMSVARFALGDNGEGAKSAPVELVALSGEVFDHAYFGPAVQDLAGMKHKAKVPIDYVHDVREIMGYVNKFDISNDELALSGALTPFSDNDRASEVMFKIREGVPYEASIYFPPSRPGELQIEELAEGEEAQVNGQTMKGPLTIFRQWTLRGVAVCPYGADAGTATHVQNQPQNVEVSVMDGEQKKEGAAVEGTEDKTPEPKAEAKAVEGAGTAATPAPEAQTQVVEKAEDPRALFRQYVEEFGQEKGSEYFGTGLSLDDARKQAVKDLREQNRKLAEAQSSGSSPVEAGGPTVEEPTLSPEREKAIKEYCQVTGRDPEKIRQAYLARG